MSDHKYGEPVEDSTAPGETTSADEAVARAHEGLADAEAASRDVVEGDEARVTSYASEVYDQNGVTQRDLGRYEDVVVKRGGRWLFKSRRFRNIHRQLRRADT